MKPTEYEFVYYIRRVNMRILIVILLCFVFACSCCAESQSSFIPLPDTTLRTYSYEYDAPPPFGKIKGKMTSRGFGPPILMVWKYSDGSTYRSYSLNGKFTCNEIDQDGDGFYESLVIYGENMNDFEQFIRNLDGTVEPISNEKYEEQKRKNKILEDLKDKAVDKSLNEMKKDF